MILTYMPNESTEVISAACQADVDLVITHHPLIFKPLTAIDTSRLEGFIIQQALDHQVAIYAAHTNLDRVKDGVNDISSDPMLDFINTFPYRVSCLLCICDYILMNHIQQQLSNDCSVRVK